MDSPVVSYSDLPAGAQVYSDLPPGASLTPPDRTGNNVQPTPGAYLSPPHDDTLAKRWAALLKTQPVDSHNSALENIRNIVANTGAGVFQGVNALIHPVDTVSGLVKSVIPAPLEQKM